MASKPLFRLRCYDESPHTAYLELPDHPEGLVPGIVKRTVDVHAIIADYHGPRLSIDFDATVAAPRKRWQTRI